MLLGDTEDTYIVIQGNSWFESVWPAQISPGHVGVSHVVLYMVAVVHILLW